MNMNGVSIIKINSSLNGQKKTTRNIYTRFSKH